MPRKRRKRDSRKSRLKDLARDLCNDAEEQMNEFFAEWEGTVRLLAFYSNAQNFVDRIKLEVKVTFFGQAIRETPTWPFDENKLEEQIISNAKNSLDKIQSTCTRIQRYCSGNDTTSYEHFLVKDANDVNAVRMHLDKFGFVLIRDSNVFTRESRRGLLAHGKEKKWFTKRMSDPITFDKKKNPRFQFVTQDAIYERHSKEKRFKVLEDLKHIEQTYFMNPEGRTKPKVKYFNEPHTVVIWNPGAVEAQKFHADAHEIESLPNNLCDAKYRRAKGIKTLEFYTEDPTYAILVPLDDSEVSPSFLDVIPYQHDLWDGSSEIPPVCFVRVFIPDDSFLLFRGDLPHRGIEYGATRNHRLHAALRPRFRGTSFLGEYKIEKTELKDDDWYDDPDDPETMESKIKNTIYWYRGPKPSRAVKGSGPKWCNKWFKVPDK